MSEKQQVTFDDTGKATLSKGRHSDALKRMVEVHNTLVEHLQLFGGDTAVIKHLLKDPAVTNKPSAVQNIIASIRDLLDEAKNDNETTVTKALEDLRGQLGEQHQKVLDDLEQQFNDRIAALTSAKEREIAALCGRAHMHDRIAIYTQAVHRVVNGHAQRTLVAPEQGIHPIMLPTSIGNGIQTSFRILFLEVNILAYPSTDEGVVPDRVRVSTAPNLGLPELNTVVLDTRAAQPVGLSYKGITALENVLNTLTPSWFSKHGTHLSQEELQDIYTNPEQAREYFDTYEAGREYRQATLRVAYGRVPSEERLMATMFGPQEAAVSNPQGFDYVGKQLASNGPTAPSQWPSANDYTARDDHSVR